MGNDVLASGDAWRVYQSMLTDERIGFAPEPLVLEAQWKKLTFQKRPTPKVWTDAYLAAFAHSASMRLVTLDRAVRMLDSEALVLH
jgi:predicted nucleic acid-binding protein